MILDPFIQEASSPVTYAIEGIRFDFHVSDSCVAGELETLLGSYRVSASSEPPDYTVHYLPVDAQAPVLERIDAAPTIHESFLYPEVPFRATLDHDLLGFCSLDDRCALFDLAENVAVISGPPSSNKGRFFTLTNTLIMPLINEMLAHKNLFFLHCACVELDGQAILMGASTGGGKTTATLALANSGYKLISDDITILDASGDEIWLRCFVRNVRVVPDVIDLLPALEHLRGRPLDDGKIEASASDVATSGVSSGAPARMLLFPQDGDYGPDHCEELDGAEALSFLVPHSLFITGVFGCEERMGGLMELVATTSAYRIRPRLPVDELPQIVRHLMVEEA